MKILSSKLKFHNFKIAICKSSKILFVLFMLIVSFPSVGNAFNDGTRPLDDNDNYDSRQGVLGTDPHTFIPAGTKPADFNNGQVIPPFPNTPPKDPPEFYDRPSGKDPYDFPDNGQVIPPFPTPVPNFNEGDEGSDYDDEGSDYDSNSVSDSGLAEDNALTRALCNIYKLVTGKAGKTFAAFAIISAGIGFFTGKLQWGLLIALTLGIAAIFGAPTIVSAITGESGSGAKSCVRTENVSKT